MADIILVIAIVLITVYCFWKEITSFKKGERCECDGHCSTCRIQCRSNPKYYGLEQKGTPKGRGW